MSEQIPEPCMCGATDCNICGPLQGYYDEDEDEDYDDFEDYDPDEDQYKDYY